MSFGDGGFKSFDASVQYIRTPGKWGDHLTLVAAAQVLMAPIRVITDSVSEDGALLVINPPHWIAQELWKDPITLAFYSERHYESTRPMAAGVKKEALKRKQMNKGRTDDLGTCDGEPSVKKETMLASPSSSPSSSSSSSSSSSPSEKARTTVPK